jgi:hypothetical protein
MIHFLRCIAALVCALASVGGIWILSVWEYGPVLDFKWAFSLMVFLALSEIYLQNVFDN